MKLFGYFDPSRAEGEPLRFGFKHLFLTLWGCVYPLMKLNLCFLLFCLPAVTIPAAVTALHAGCVDLIRGERVRVFRLFVSTLRKQFFSAWAVLTAILGPCALSILNAWFYFSCAAQWKLLLIPGLTMSAIAVILLLMLPYALTMLARVDLGIRKVLKNAFLLTFLNLPFSLCGSLLVLLMLVLSALYWLYALPLTVTFTFALCAYIGVYFSLYGLQRFVLTQEL